MKLRWVRRTAVGVLLLLAVLAVATFDAVDVRPYFQQSYFQETYAQVPRAVSSATVRGSFTAGFGRAKLTPRLGAPRDEPARGEFRQLPLAGYGARQGRPATGVHDDLEVKAVVCRVADKTAVVIALDELIVPPEITALAAERLTAQFGLGRAQLYFSATHTHAGLGGWGEGRVAESFAGGYTPGVREWVAQQIVEAVAAALRDVRPATLGQARFTAREFVRNRLVGDAGAVDPEFSFAVIEQAGGGRAVLGSFAAHATVLSADNMEFSADYPGYWQRAVETATGGLALFVAGSVGSHGPVAGAKGFAGAERMGHALAAQLLAELPRVSRQSTVSFGIATVEVSLPEFNVRVSDAIRLRPWVARQVLPVGQGCVIQALRLDRVAWISTPCDFSGELALGIKDHLRQRDADAVVTSFNGGYIGYVVPEKYYHLAAYESRTMSFFGPYVPDYFDQVIRALAVGILADKAISNQ